MKKSITSHTILKLFVVVALLNIFSANAQKVIIKSMDDFRKSPGYAKRQAKSGIVVKKFPTQYRNFPNEKTRLKVTIDKPSGPTGIVKKVIDKNPKKDPNSPSGFDCYTQHVSLSCNSTNFSDNEAALDIAKIFPGACYTLTNLTSGNWNLQKGARYPLTITTTNHNTSVSYVENVAADAAHVNGAITTLFNAAKNVNGSEVSTYAWAINENSAASNLALGGGISGYGASVSGSYSDMSQSKHVYLTVDARKVMYSIFTAIPDSGIFKDASIEKTVDYLTMVTQVDYGVRILGNVDIEFASSSEAESFRASYSGFGIDANFSLAAGSSSSSYSITINSYIIGGPGNTMVAHSINEFNTQVNKAYSQITYKTAQPLQYYLCDMLGNSMQPMSETDDFEERTCIPAGKGEEEIKNVIVSFGTGNDDKHQETRFAVQIFSGNNANIQDASKLMFANDYMGQLIYFPANSQPSTATEVFLNPFNQYKGKLTVDAIQKAGGGTILIVFPQHQNVSQDYWDVTQVNVTFYIKPTSANPNPKPLQVGVGKMPGFNLSQNPHVIKTDDPNSYLVLHFDGNFSPL